MARGDLIGTFGYVGLLIGGCALAGCGGSDPSGGSGGGGGAPQLDPEGICYLGASDHALLEDPDVIGRLPEQAPAGFAIHDLGVVTTHDGVSKELHVDADDETRAFHIVVLSHPTTVVSVVSANAPDGTPFISPTADADAERIRIAGFLTGLAGPGLSPNRVVSKPREASVLIPNTPALSMQAGQWTFRVGTFASAEGTEDPTPGCVDAAARVFVVERRVAAPATAKLDLVFTFSPESGLDAASAPTDPNVQRALERLDESFGSVGIGMGNVTYRDGPGMHGVVDLGAPACVGGPDVERLFDEAKPVPVDALQLVFVDHFTCDRGGIDAGAGLAGASNGLPGLPFAKNDGVMVGTSLMKMYPEDWALVVAHETGHYLGLFHTCELAGEICDGIPDTKEGGGADANLMYPNVSLSTDDGLTQQQGDVVRLSPLITTMP